MIEGLIVTLEALELRGLCQSRADFHRGRCDEYAKNLSALEASAIEGMNYTGGDPKRAVKERMDTHRTEQYALQFIAGHLDMNQTYRLGNHDMKRLGIGNEY